MPPTWTSSSGQYVNHNENDIYADIIQQALGGSRNSLEGEAYIDVSTYYRDGADRNNIFIDLGIG